MGQINMRWGDRILLYRHILVASHAIFAVVGDSRATVFSMAPHTGSGIYDFKGLKKAWFLKAVNGMPIVSSVMTVYAIGILRRSKSEIDFIVSHSHPTCDDCLKLLTS